MKLPIANMARTAQIHIKSAIDNVIWMAPFKDIDEPTCISSSDRELTSTCLSDELMRPDSKVLLREGNVYIIANFTCFVNVRCVVTPANCQNIRIVLK